jgi:hypothetical protein
MTRRPPRFYYTFAVKLTETVKIMAPSEDEARALLARGFLYDAPARNLDWKAEPRILEQALQQGDIELLTTEDPWKQSWRRNASASAASIR